MEVNRPMWSSLKIARRRRIKAGRPGRKMEVRRERRSPPLSWGESLTNPGQGRPLGMLPGRLWRRGERRFSALTEDWTDHFLSSSSSEEEDEYQRDVQLKQDIHQLERTLNNYDTQFDRRDREHRELAKQKLLKLKVRREFCNVFS